MLVLHLVIFAPPNPHRLLWNWFRVQTHFLLICVFRRREMLIHILVIILCHWKNKCSIHMYPIMNNSKIALTFVSHTWLLFRNKHTSTIKNTLHVSCSTYYFHPLKDAPWTANAYFCGTFHTFPAIDLEHSGLMVYSDWLTPGPGPENWLVWYYAEHFTLHRDWNRCQDWGIQEWVSNLIFRTWRAFRRWAVTGF